jgi:hypothetical protein
LGQIADQIRAQLFVKLTVHENEIGTQFRINARRHVDGRDFSDDVEIQMLEQRFERSQGIRIPVGDNDSR